MPPIKYKYPKADAATIPTALAGFYVERDGHFYLDAEGVVEAEMLNEFRDNNRELMRLIGAKTPADAKAKLAKLAAIDPDEHERIKTELQTYIEGKAPKLDELVTTRTEAMKKDFEKREKDKDASILALTTRLSKVLIDDALTTAAAKKGVLPGAIEDIRLRGNRVFKLENEIVVAHGPDGKQIYGKDSKELTIDEWLDKQAVDAPHLFSPNKGGGAGGGGGAGNTGFTGPNPFSRKSFNLTKQAELKQQNPELFERLKVSAEN